MAEQRILSVSKIIARLGGPAKAAELCGVGDDAIRKWREKQYIPALRWPKIVRAANGKITYDMLEALYEQAVNAAPDSEAT